VEGGSQVAFQKKGKRVCLSGAAPARRKFCYNKPISGVHVAGEKPFLAQKGAEFRQMATILKKGGTKCCPLCTPKNVQNIYT
jgi:hypothetical protein